MKKLLGAVSPAYALMSGKGAIADAMGKGQLGAMPRSMMKSVRKDGTPVSAEEEEKAAKSGMKRGGKVKAYAKGGMTRGDGICAKGKTKGRVT